VVPAAASGQLTLPHVNLQSPAKVGLIHRQPVAGAAQSAGAHVDTHVAVLHAKVRSPEHAVEATPADVAHVRVWVPPPQMREHTL